MARDGQGQRAPRLIEWRTVAIKAFNGFQLGQAFTSNLRSEAVVAELGQRS